MKNEEELIQRIVAKLTDEEKQYFMDELVGYPRAIDAGAGATPDEQYVSEFELDVQKYGWGDDSQKKSAFRKAYHQFIKENPVPYTASEAWRKEIKKLWPEDEELLKFYHSFPVKQPVPFPKPTPKDQIGTKQPKYGSPYDQNDNENECVTTLDDHVRFEHVRLVNKKREEFIETYKDIVRSHAAKIAEFRKQWRDRTLKPKKVKKNENPTENNL